MTQLDLFDLDTHLDFKRRRYDGLTIEEKIDEALLILDTILYAFPEGPSKHREIHEAWMSAKRAETEFWNSLKLDLIKKGLWGIIIVLVGLVLVGITTKLGVHNGP